MKDIKLRADGDLDFSTRTLRLTDDNGPEYASQRITQRSRFFLGEWFLNLRLGVPFFKYVLVKNPDLFQIRSIYRKIIKLPCVSSIDRLDVQLNKPTRTATIPWKVRLVSGEVLEDTTPLQLPE